MAYLLPSIVIIALALPYPKITDGDGGCLDVKEYGCHKIGVFCYIQQKALFDCQGERTYHCAWNPGKHHFEEGCAVAKKCREGEEPLLFFDEHGQAFITCKKCREYNKYYNPKERWSNIYSSCDEKKDECKIEDYKIMCSLVDSADMYTKNRRCRCDVKNGYRITQDYPKDKHACTDDKFWDCERMCGENQDVLLLGYQCADKCPPGESRSDEDSDECIPIPTRGTPKPATTKDHSTLSANMTTTTPTTTTTPAQTSATSPVKASSPALNKEIPSDEVFSYTGTIVSINVIFSLMIFAGIIIFCCRKKIKTLMRNCRGRNRRSQDANDNEQDANDIEMHNLAGQNANRQNRRRQDANNNGQDANEIEPLNLPDQNANRQNRRRQDANENEQDANDIEMHNLPDQNANRRNRGRQDANDIEQGGNDIEQGGNDIEMHNLPDQNAKRQNRRRQDANDVEIHNLPEGENLLSQPNSSGHKIVHTHIEAHTVYLLTGKNINVNDNKNQNPETQHIDVASNETDVSEIRESGGFKRQRSRSFSSSVTDSTSSEVIRANTLPRVQKVELLEHTGLSNDVKNEMFMYALRKVYRKLVYNLEPDRLLDQLTFLDEIAKRDIQEQTKSSDKNRDIIDTLKKRRWTDYFEFKKCLHEMKSYHCINILQEREKEFLKDKRTEADQECLDQDSTHDYSSRFSSEPSSVLRHEEKLTEDQKRDQDTNQDNKQPGVNMAEKTDTQTPADFPQGILDKVENCLQMLSYEKAFEHFKAKAVAMEIPSCPIPIRSQIEHCAKCPYKKCPDGFQSYFTTGDFNSCLYQAISLLLYGNEKCQNLLRLLATLYAAKNIDTICSEFIERLKDKDKDGVLTYFMSMTKDTSLPNDYLEMSKEDLIQYHVQMFIMETPQIRKDSCQMHVYFLSQALQRSIIAYSQRYEDDIIDTIVEGDELEPLHIMWVNSADNPEAAPDHVVALVKDQDSEQFVKDPDLEKKA